MILELKVRKFGNSPGIVVPKEALNHLRVEEGDLLTATEADAALRTLAFAAGEMTESAYAAWLEANSKKRKR